MPSLCGALVLLLWLGQTLNWKMARPDYAWSFPQDHWAKNGYLTEWWYFTGHLASTEITPRKFGYQFTFFRIGLHPSSPPFTSNWTARNAIMGHAAVTDLNKGIHTFTEVLHRAVPLLGQFGTPPNPLVAWIRSPTGSPGRWTLSWNGSGFDLVMVDQTRDFSFNLTTKALKGPILQGPNGYSIKGKKDGLASQYYSFPRLLTQGSLFIRGEKIQVQGSSWMDKEFGSNQLGAEQVGWDWFGLQLEDGRDLMIYLIRNRHQEVDLAQATLISKKGQVQYLEQDKWTVKSTQTWTSPITGARYPSQWLVQIPGETLQMVITPELAEAENVSQIFPYWEGPVRIETAEGDQLGRGYVELTGYSDGSRPPL